MFVKSLNRIFSISKPSLSTMANSRYLKNTIPDYDNQKYLLEDGSLIEDTRIFMISNFKRLFEHWESHLVKNIEFNDISVYTGITGAAILYLKIYESKIFPDSDQYLNKAWGLIQTSLKYYGKVEVFTFMCGEIGVLATAALICKYLNQDYEQFIRDIVSVGETACTSAQVPDEVLYGRAGYLYTLLLLRAKIPESLSLISDQLIRNVTKAMLDSGVKTSGQIKSNFPLTYFWFDEPYIGAAHGYLGILYMLMESFPKYIDEKEFHDLIKPTLDAILDLQFDSGNFPPCFGEKEDKLVHWCHGSPGAVYSLSSAYIHFKDDKYLNAAKKCGEDVWQRGLLKKGYGLCHGISGNAYAFLKLFQLTNDPKYLYRAIKFAEYCCDYGKHGCRTPDRPYSLFEGMAGTLYFILDLLHPLQARFPIFQL